MKFSTSIRTLAAVAALAASFDTAALFRTYVSINGNDANPCTLPAPCRLLPPALAAVDDGGEVWILDSGNFNTSNVNVNKSVSILAVPAPSAAWCRSAATRSPSTRRAPT